MSSDYSDRNLLFGILAQQMDFITRNQLVTAMQTWALTKTTPLGEILCNEDALSQDARALLEALVKEHLVQHGNDPKTSLAAVSSAGSVHEHLKEITDPDIQASLTHLASNATAKEDPFATSAGTAQVNAPKEDPFATSAGTAQVNTPKEDPFSTQAQTAQDKAPAEDPYATNAQTAHGNATSDQTDRESASGGRVPSVGELTSSGIRFRILRPHARGGLGEVHVARDEELHREVALKRIQDRHADNAESQGRFLLEAEITGGLEHPGIVPVYGLGQYADGRPYYAMRFIRGDSLKDALEQFHKADIPGRDPGERSLQLRALLGRFVDVCDAIAYAHSRGVLHRDLKPGNIMLGKYGETLVVDWGLAKTVDSPVRPATGVGEGNLTLHSGSLGSQTVMGAVVGTPQFMSPEQAGGRLNELGPASDVYSLGATLYCVLTGQPPYVAPDVVKVLAKVEKGDFPKPREIKANISQALEAICLKAMAHAPSERYTTPRMLADDIEHWLADEPVSAWREPWTLRARRWMRRHRTLVAGFATFVLVAGIALGVATVLLTAANERVRAARDLAQKNAKEAEHNFKLSRGAVDHYYTEISEDVLLNEPSMEPMRKKLLEAAGKYYEQFVHEHAGDANVHEELAYAYFRLAQITGEIGSKQDAIDMHDKARQIFSSLLKAQPADRNLQSGLADCLHHMGRLCRGIYQFNKAEKACKEALTYWDALVNEQADDARALAGQARSQLGLGNVYQLKSRLADARKQYEASLTTREKLAKDHPDVVEYQRDLNMSRHNLAFIQGAQREIESAKQLYELVKEVQKQLVEKSPRISQYQDDLARTYYNLGDLYRQSDKESAKTAYQQAVNRWRDLTERHPDVLIFQRNLADALCRLSMAYSNTADTRKAEELANQAIGILSGEHKSDPQFRDGLAQAYIHRGNVLRKAKNAPLAEGNYQQAQEILQELVKTHPEVPQYQNELANCLNDRGLLEEAEKEKAFRGALELWQRLHKNYPEDLEFALGVNTAARNLGDMLAFNKDPKVSEGALDCYRQALAALAPQDQNPAVRDAICKTYTQRAMFYVQLKSPLAQEDWNQAFLFAREPTAIVRYYRAMFLSQEREHVGAVALADSLVDDPNMSREGLFQLACIYARCCAAATPDAMLSLGPNSKSEGYADSSLKCLYKARELGYFKNPRNLEKLKKPDLDSLRQRMDFQRFLSEVEPPGGAGVKP